MTDRDPEPPRTLLSMQALRWRALAEIRQQVSLDQYRRTVAVCSIDGVDLAEWLVRNGLALDWPTYSKGKYDKAQRDAEHAGRGMWAGSYIEPWLFRACIRQGGKPGDCSDDANTHP